MSDDLNIIVLAGGFGKRLKNTIGNIPKILAPINDKPFIYFLIEWIKPLMEGRDSNLIFSLHHEADQIIDYISNKSLTCKYIVDQKPLGTFGAVCNAVLHFKSNNYLILNGDTLFMYDLNIVYQKFLSKRELPFLILKDSNTNERYGGYLNDGEYWKLSKNKSSAISMGAYFVSHSTLVDRWKMLTGRCFSKINLENYENLPIMNDKDFLGLSPVNGYSLDSNIGFIDIGVRDSFLKGQFIIPTIIRKLKRDF